MEIVRKGFQILLGAALIYGHFALNDESHGVSGTGADVGAVIC